MKKTKTLISKILKLLAIFYILLCALLYFFQEKLIFSPQKLDKRFTFHFEQPFREISIQTNNGELLSGLLFKADSTKGLIFYLHGNTGALNTWGGVAKTYTALGYDVFMLDYPGYGKSEGVIKNQSQLFNAVQAAYAEVRKNYNEDKIVIIGYSIGTGLAAKLASVNHPKLLILQAPYYSLTDLVKHRFPFIPTFLLRYKLETNDCLKTCTMPVVLFHGTKDEVIYYNSSQKLRAELKRSDTLITLNGQGHNGMTNNPDYIKAITRILEK